MVQKNKTDLLNPESLAGIQKQKTIHINLRLTDRTIEFFKKQAKKYDVSYQIMIRDLLDHYVVMNSNEDEE